jgi:hypothetical protein
MTSREHVHPMPGQQLINAPWGFNSSGSPEGAPYPPGSNVLCCETVRNLAGMMPPGWRERRVPGQVHPDERPVELLGEANAITSMVARSGGEWHRPLLDLDIPASLVPSSTPGHSHLYIAQTISWDQMAGLLRAFGHAGLIAPASVRLAMEQGYTALRLPWVHKTELATA